MNKTLGWLSAALVGVAGSAAPMKRILIDNKVM